MFNVVRVGKRDEHRWTDVRGNVQPLTSHLRSKRYRAPAWVATTEVCMAIKIHFT
jgi:hypothetical protein